MFSIADGALLDGRISPAKQKLVVAWIEIHRDELMADWNLAVVGENVFKIKRLE